MEQKPPNGSIPPCLNGTTHAGLAVDYAISLLLAAYTTTAATGPMPPSWLQGVRKLRTLPPAPPPPGPLRPRPGPLALGRAAFARATGGGRLKARWPRLLKCAERLRRRLVARETLLREIGEPRAIWQSHVREGFLRAAA